MKKPIVMNNIFYFRKISKIGGTEQFLYEIAKKYQKYDITIFYDEADEFQIDRLRKLVRCKKRRKGEVVKCKRAFFNFNLDMIEDVEADEYYFVSHANYEELNKVHGGYIPPIKNEKITHYIGVSQFATDKLDEYAEFIGSKIKTQRCYNPLTLEPKEKVLHLVSAGRIDDKVKGGERTQKLIEALDKYCTEKGRHYIWTIFTNPTKEIKIKSPNVALMQPRIDVRPFIADADYVLQLSNNMETYCYTINEALGYGVPIVTTPLSILNELPITDNEHIVLDWDCKNVDEVVRQIFEKKVNKFIYNPPEDNWEDFLIKNKSIYKEERKMRFKVRATNKYINDNIWDAELSKEKGIKEYKPVEGEEWDVDYDRKEKLTELGFVTVVEEIKEDNEIIEEKEDIKEAKGKGNTKKKTEEVEVAKKGTKGEKAVKDLKKKEK